MADYSLDTMVDDKYAGWERDDYVRRIAELERDLDELEQVRGFTIKGIRKERAERRAAVIAEVLAKRGTYETIYNAIGGAEEVFEYEPYGGEIVLVSDIEALRAKEQKP